jgi:branched-chain amino acid transport system ATP-binding protein
MNSGHPEPPDELLVGTGLSKSYGGVHAVSQVSFTLHAGEVLGLIGPNGAGKTTLVDLITGAQDANAGNLVLRGEPLRGNPATRAVRGLARTFQHPQLALDLTVADNLLLGSFAARHRGLGRLLAGLARGMVMPRSAGDRDLATQLGDQVGLTDLHRHARDLTLGEQRLVEVGRALGSDPSVLLLDEPFAGSDAHGVAGITSVIEMLRDRGHAVILVDHNVDLVTRLADQVVLMARGQVAFEGSPAECLASPEMQAVYFGIAEDTGPEAAMKVEGARSS